MTAETNVIDGVSGGSNVEFEGKSALNLISGGDLENAGADCNGIAHGKEEFGKEETDSSYVFVNGGSSVEGDLDVVDPEEGVEMEAVSEGIDELELNAGSSSERKFEELKEEKGEIGESCEENSRIIDDSEELGEKKEENGEICVENDSAVEETVVSLAADCSHENDAFVEDVIEVEENKESHIAVVESVQSELTISSLTQQTMVESEELKEEEGEREESFVESSCIVEHTGAESEELGDTGGGGESYVANGCVAEETGLSLSTDDLKDGPHKHNLVENGDVVESQKALAVVESVQSELNIGSLTQQTIVESEELKAEKRESCVEIGCIVEHTGAESEELGDKGEGGESCVVNGCVVEETDLSLSTDDLNNEPHKDDLVKNGDVVESQKELAVVEGVQSELNISSLTQQTMVVSEELKEEKGEREESCVESGCIVEYTGAESEELGDKGEGGESYVTNGCVVEETGLSLSTDDLNDKPHKDDLVENGDVVESQKELELVVEVEDNQQSQIMVMEAVESELSAASSSEQTVVENLTEEKEEVRERCVADSCVVEEIVVSKGTELEQLREEIEENAESCVANHSIVVEDIGVSSSLDGKYDEQNEGDEAKDTTESRKKLELGMEANEDNKSQNAVMENVESEDSELHLLEKGNGTDMPNIAGELLPEESTGELGMEQELTTDCSVGEKELETNVADGPVELAESHTENGRDLPISALSDTKLEGAVENGSPLAGESSQILQIDNVKSENEKRNGHVETVDIASDECCIHNSKSKTEATNAYIESSELLVTCTSDDLELETKVENGHNESIISSPVNDNSESALQKDEVKSESEVQNDLLESTEKSADATAATLDGVKLDAELGKRLLNFIIKIPRYADDGFRTKIKTAQLQVDEKTQHRDSIRVAMQQQKAKFIEYREKFEAARLEERASRDAVFAKRQEMESVQVVINRMRNATSIEEIEDRMHNMEHMIEHETMPLTEEKQLLREIKQLKHARDQLCANSGTHAQIQEAFDQKDNIEERFKHLKKELDSLRSEIQRTEAITNVAKKKHHDEFEKLKELQVQFKAADNLRQEAYARLQELKKQSYEKNKYFRMYKEDERMATDYASRGEREAVQHHCTNQVEKVMELWNNNDEFRKDYVKHNMMSTIRRFRTLDGRSLGPDEEPPVIRNLMEERTDAAHLASAERSTSAVASNSEMKLEKPCLPVSIKESVEKPKVGAENLSAKSKKSTKPTSKETVPVTVSSWADIVEETEKESERTKEEEEAAKKAVELAKKEEELRKEEAAARLKEQRRLEEKAKAKEAEERKRRNAEKARARAELKAQKEAELKEKEREKKLRKKERKKVAAVGIMSGGTEGVAAEVSENTQTEAATEPESKEKSATVIKRTSKSLPATKQSKTKPLPPPLRNRSKRKMQSWMWVLLIAVLLLALFFLANNISSLKLGSSGFGF